MSTYDREYILNILRRQENDYLVRKAQVKLWSRVVLLIVAVSIATVLGIEMLSGQASILHAGFSFVSFGVMLMLCAPLGFASAERYAYDLGDKADKVRRSITEFTQTSDATRLAAFTY